MIAGYVGAIAGGAGLILIPHFDGRFTASGRVSTGKKLASYHRYGGCDKNFMKSSSIVWHIVPVGIVAALIGAFVGAKKSF